MKGPWRALFYQGSPEICLAGSILASIPVWAENVIHYKEGRQLTDRIEMKINERELKRIDKRK